MLKETQGLKYRMFIGWPNSMKQLHRKKKDLLTNYMRGGLILFYGYVASSHWDVKHFQHSLQKDTYKSSG